MQVTLAQLLQFDVMYGNTDAPTLGGRNASAVPPQKLGVLETNADGEQGLGGCDGRDEVGLYILADESSPPASPPGVEASSGSTWAPSRTRRDYEAGAGCSEWEYGSCPPLRTPTRSHLLDPTVRDCACTAGPSYAHLEWLSTNGLKTHNLCLCYMPNLYTGTAGTGILSVSDLIVQHVDGDGNGFYLASSDCGYGIYAFEQSFSRNFLDLEVRATTAQ